MDITDKKTLKILSENSNATATEISNLANLSVPTVNKRILRMQKEGITTLLLQSMLYPEESIGVLLKTARQTVR